MARPRLPRQRRICPTCGQEFEVELKHPNAIYCSLACWGGRLGSLAERLISKVNVLPNGCWQWTGNLDDQGYGRHGPLLAHRLSHETFKGPIPEGVILDHSCHDPKTCAGGITCPHRACINPDHADHSSRAENTSRERSCRSAEMKIQAREHPRGPLGHFVK